MGRGITVPPGRDFRVSLSSQPMHNVSFADSDKAMRLREVSTFFVVSLEERKLKTAKTDGGWGK